MKFSWASLSFAYLAFTSHQPLLRTPQFLMRNHTAYTQYTQSGWDWTHPVNPVVNTKTISVQSIFS